MIGIIFLLNLEYAPYLKKYTSELDKLNIKYEIITWNRLENTNPVDSKLITYTKPSNLGNNKVRKMIDFIGFRKFLINTIKSKKYDKLIVLTTLTGIIINDLLVENYENKFVFDIRDYTFERNSIYRLIEKRIIEASNFTSISSEGFTHFLPNSDKYVVSHNIILEEILEAKNYYPNKISSPEKINLTFVGAVRHFDIEKQIADIFGTDSRYNVTYHGYGVSYDRFKNYCTENNRNVELTGKYDRNDKFSLMKNVDIVNAYYHEDIFANKFALPNKFYDALIYKIPLWANPHVYVGQRAIEKGIGLNVMLDENAPDKIYSDFKNLDWERFYICCQNELMKVLEEDRIFQEKLNRFILN